MENKLKEFFVQTHIVPNEDLTGQVWERIIIRNKKIANFKVILFSILGITSLAGTVPAFINLSKGFANSGFYEYLSLLFSGNGELSMYWKELSLSLAESIPALEITYILMLVFILFLSAKYISKQIAKNKLVLSF